MCQIFAGPSNKIRALLMTKPGLLENLLQRNKDGLGAMYATSKHVLRTPKIVPKDFKDALNFLRQLPDDDRNLVIHFRMKTSGNIDHDNAHPFIVVEGEFAMTHNGVLQYPTKSDVTMCDTRHYIRDVIRPQLELCPELARSSAWLWLIEREIGSNRFVIMDRTGYMSFVNKKSGYDFEDIWFANKYSFDAALLDESFAPPPPRKYQGAVHSTGPYPTSGYSGGVAGYWVGNKFHPYDRVYDPDDAESLWDSTATSLHKKKSSEKVAVLPPPSPAEQSAQAFIDADVEDLGGNELELLAGWLEDAIGLCDAAKIREALLLAPKATVATLFAMGTYTPGAPTGMDQYSKLDERISNMLVDQDDEGLVELVKVSKARAQNVAEVIAWFGSWAMHIDDEEADEPESGHALVIRAAEEASIIAHGEIVGEAITVH